MFVDEVTVHARGGRGGNGVTSFARQPFEPKGPPDGGDGGAGGDVVARATADVATLVDLHHRPHRRGEDGRHGSSDLRRGADGGAHVVLVPVGTVVKDPEGAVLADLVRPGAEIVLARGGRGGRGNAAFRTARRRAPRFHERGEPGHDRTVVLELKLAADVALVGFPNVGKSSLIARLSAARPKIADYPFTTLVPNLGVVRTEDVDLVVADVPGLIAGASEGRGLGRAFLRHVERALVLVHVLDCASYEQRDPRDDLDVVLRELEAYQPDLVDRPGLVWLNKVDADREVAEIVEPDLVAAGWEVLRGSAVTGEGVDALRYRLASLVAEERARLAVQVPQLVLDERPVLRPRRAASGRDFRVVRAPGGWRVEGERIERWVVVLDLDNHEAVAYLQSRLVRAGVEAALAEAGARRGDDVEIAGAVFTFAPEGVDPEDLADDVDHDLEDDELDDDDVEHADPEDVDDRDGVRG